MTRNGGELEAETSESVKLWSLVFKTGGGDTKTPALHARFIALQDRVCHILIKNSRPEFSMKELPSSLKG